MHVCTHTHARAKRQLKLCLLEELVNFLRCDQGEYLGPFPPGCSSLVACVVLNINSLPDPVCLVFQDGLCLNGSASGRDCLPFTWDSLSAQGMALLPPFPAMSVALSLLYLSVWRWRPPLERALSGPVVGVCESPLSLGPMTP